jgi:hypothetical protein
MPRYSRKYKRGGIPPRMLSDGVPGNSNVQPVEYAEPDSLYRENNLAEPLPTPRPLEIGQVDPRSVGLTPEQRIEYESRLRDGRQGDFTRIYHEEDISDDDYGDYKQRVGRKTSKKRKSSKTVKKS